MRSLFCTGIYSQNIFFKIYVFWAKCPHSASEKFKDEDKHKMLLPSLAKTFFYLEQLTCTILYKILKLEPQMKQKLKRTATPK